MHTNELGVMCTCVNAMYTSHSYTLRLYQAFY